MTPEQVSKIFKASADADDSVSWQVFEAIAAESQREIAEAVESAAKVADGWKGTNCTDDHQENPCCHARTALYIAETIRRLSRPGGE